MLSRSSEEIIFSKGVSTNISLIGDDTDPYYRGRTCSVKTFIAGYNKVLKTPSHQTVFPSIAAKWCWAVFAVSDQRVQGVSGFIDGNKPVLVLKFRSKADLWEIRAPVRCKLGFFEVEPSFSSFKVVGVFVRPEWVVVIGCAAREFFSTSQKHYQDLGSDTSSVWNFCARYSDAQVATSRNVGCFLRLPTLPLGRDRASSKTSIEDNLSQTPKQTALHADLGCPRLDERCNNFCIKILAKVSRDGPLSHHLAMTRAHVHEYQTRGPFLETPDNVPSPKTIYVHNILQ